MKTAKKAAAIILSAVVSATAVTALSPGASAEWVKSKSGYSYKDDATGERLTGWQTIGGGKYYFDKNGIALTGWKTINGNTYYFNGKKRGRMLTGRAKINGKQYYFGSNGVMRTGWVKIKDNTYYFNTNGVMVTGTYNIYGKSYKFGKDGVLKSDAKTLEYTVDDVLQGLEFGMSQEEARKASPWNELSWGAPSETSMNFTVSDTAEFICSFDEKGEYCFCFILLDDVPALSEAKGFFTKAGWVCRESNKENFSYSGLYISPDETMAASLFYREENTEWGMATIYVTEYSNINEIWQ